MIKIGETKYYCDRCGKEVRKNTYCNGACNETKRCPYQDLCSADLIETTTFEDLENIRKSFITGMEFDKKDCVRDGKEFKNLSPFEFACHMSDGIGHSEALKHFGIDIREVYMNQISEQIKDKAEVIANLISNGKHVELCENKDGLRIISMDRKVVK